MTRIDIRMKIRNNSQGSSFTALAVGQLVAAIKTNGHHKFEVPKISQIWKPTTTKSCRQSKISERTKLIQVSPWAPRKPYRPPRRDPVRALLPEYYLKTRSALKYL